MVEKIVVKQVRKNRISISTTSRCAATLGYFANLIIGWSDDNRQIGPSDNNSTTPEEFGHEFIQPHCQPLDARRNQGYY